MKNERELIVSKEEIALQLARTNISAAVLVEGVGAAHAINLMQIFAATTLRFPAASSIFKASIVVFIRKELEGTYKGEKKRRAIVKRAQQELEERGIKCTRRQIERIYKAGKWVE